MLPVGGVFLIFCGVLKLIFFYSHFNISIINYLNIQEVILSFLQDINIIIVFALVMSVATFGTMNIISKKTNLPSETVYTGLKYFVYERRFLYADFFLLVLLVVFLLLDISVIEYGYIIICLVVFSTFQLLTYLVMKREASGKIEIPNFYHGAIPLVVLIFSLYMFARLDIQTVESNLKETTLILENDTLEMNRSTKNLYIGKTNGFVFVRIDSSNSTVVVPIEMVKQYRFK